MPLPCKAVLSFLDSCKFVQFVSSSTDMQPPPVLILAGLLIAAVVVIIWLWQRYVTLLQEHEAAIKEARQRSVEQSRSTLKGQIAEQMAPLLPGFPFSAADAR